MRFLHYLQPKVGKETNIFRSMDIKLVDIIGDSYTSNINKIYNTYKLNDNIIDIVDNLNKELKIVYSGKYKFALCVNEGVSIDDVKINKKYISRIKTKLFSANDILAKLKTEVEKRVKHENIYI